MDIFTTKESALIHLNSTRIAAGEIRVYRYYSSTGSTESFVVIGLQDGVGPDCYQILSKRKNLIVNIDTELPDSSRLIQGQVHVCPVNGIYHMVYIEDSQRIDREISDSEVYYVEDFDSGFMYYLDRYTCKKLDDYFSKVYIDLSNTNALYEAGKYPETTVTVWKDNADITSACQIGITTTGCSAIYDGSKTIRVTGMTERTAKVVIKVIYRGNTYQETWNIQKVQEGIKGADAEVWSVLSKNSFIREPDMQVTTFQVLYQSGSELSHLEVPSLQNYGLRLTYEYSDGTVGQIDTQDFEFESRITDDDTELTFCIVRLLNSESEVLSAITLPYLPNTSTLSSGQGVYKAVVFCRSNDIPETPLGGSWDSPIPTTGNWSQEAPEGSKVLWTSTRIFTTDAKTPQDAVWSVPSRISNTENLDVMYSTCQDSTIVGTPSTKPENWEKVVTGIAYFMATRTITNGVPGLWQIFAIHGIDGEASDYKNYIYINSTTKPETPVGSHPDGWCDFPDSDGIWWMCVGLFSGRSNELIGTWSNPIKVTGIDGGAGQDAPYLIYQYAIGTSPTDAPTYNWSSSIPTVPKGMYLWQRSGTVTPPATAPTTWNVPVRITGERGEQGAPGTAVTIDLTNEVSSVAADYEGNVVAAATFETTQVLLYNNSNPIDLESDRKVRSITIIPDGVQARVSKSGLVTIESWTAPKEQDTATVVVNVNYNYNTYTAIYSIQKVKAGAPGKDAVLYSIIPSTNVLRKVNTTISPRRLTAQVRKAVGPDLSNITNLDSEGIELVYSINGSPDETYDFVEGIDTTDVEYVTLTLKSKATGSVIDKETILTMESTIDLIVDLTNEVSAVAALENGELSDYSNFEKSKVRIYYGSLPVDPSECQIKASWSNMKGEFNSLTGVITPTGWDPDKLGEYTGQCTLEVTYKEFTKAVTYTVTKINSGETPVLYRLMPEASVVKISDSGISKPNLRCSVWQIVGRERTLINPEEFSEKNLKLVYKCIKNTEDSEETNDIEFNYSEPGVPMSNKIEEVTFYFYDITDPHNPLILDQETVPVLRDGTSAYAVVVDLTNENSCVAADYDGVVPEGAVFEPTRVLIYRNGNQLEVTDTSIGQIELDCSGVEAEIDTNGVITVNSWTAPVEQQVATIEVTVPVDEIEYKCVYSIVKIKAGASGETPVLYSLMPSSNIIRKFNGKLSVDRLFVDILRTHGLDKSIVSPSQEDLVLKYTENYGNETEYTNSGISISDTTESIQVILRDSNGTTIDRETIIVVETAIDLVVDLTNESSCVAADHEGNLYSTSSFETSTVQIHYGSKRIGFSDPDLQAEITWTGLKGTFVGGLITPTEWTSVDDTASATVKITYDKFVKTVTYSITRVRAGENGETPVLYSLMPSSSAIRKFNGKLSTNKLYVDVLKTQGLDRSIVTSLGNEGLVLKYIKNSGNEFDYTGSGITIDNDTEQVQVILRDSDNTVIDRETIVVIESAVDLMVDLTNEASVIAADYEGKLYDAGLFETSTVQVYYGSTLISFSELGRSGAEITWTGIQGTFENGVITPTKWTSTGDTASATVKITYGGFVKTVTYNITRVRAGENGETPVLYSLLPSANVIRKLNGRLSTNRLFTDILKTDGPDRSTVLPGSEGLVIKYIENSGSETDYTSTGVPITGDTEQVQFVLKGSDGVVLDKETIVVIESEIGLVVDLTNENSCIAADYDGNIYDANLFETSTVQVYYGGEPVDFSDTKLRKEITWTGIQGTFENGVIKPTKWTNNDSDTASAVVKITYGDFTKTVTYSVARVRAGADGKTPVLYRLIPDASLIKVSAAGIPSRSYLKCAVWKVTGKERALIDTNNLSSEGLKLSYHRSTDSTSTDISSNEVDMSDYTSSGVSIANNTRTSGIVFYLYDITDPSAPFIVDQEAVPVLKDGTNGTDAYAVVVDLTNESSCVVSDAEGNIPDGTTFEPTKLLIYRNGVLLRPVGDARVGKIRLDCNGVAAEVDDYGVIRVNSWTASSSQSVATVEVTVPVDGVDYKCIYSITKVRTGENGESPVIYSLVPSSDIIRKLNKTLSTDRLFVSILKTQGLKKETILPSQDGLSLTYIKNDGDVVPYTDAGISISGDTEYVQLILKNSSGTIIDRETIIVVETAIDLEVDLTNESSCIAADSDGNIYDTSLFETSTVQIYYGARQVDFSDPDLSIDVTWTGIEGSFSGGLITPTRWRDSGDLASVMVKVTYDGITKTVTYNIIRVKAGSDGMTPVLWQLVPDVTSLKATTTSVSRDSISVDVYKIVGASRTIITPDKFRAEKVKLVYARTYTVSGTESDKVYQNYIPITTGITKVEVTLYDFEENVLDRESIPVVYDGVNAYNVVLDLTNENSNVIADKDGNLIGNIEDTEVKLYRNQEEIRLSSIPNENITVEWYCIQGSWNVTTGKFTNIKWKEDDYSKASNSGYVRINVTYQGITYSKVYTVTKVREAEDGKSPVLYSVIPSVNSIKVAGNVVYTPQLTVGVNRHTVEGTTALSKTSIEEDGLEIVYRVDNDPNYRLYSDYIEVNSDNIQFDVAVRKRGSDTFIDRETVPVVRDGAAGRKSDWKDYIFCKSESQPPTPTFRKHPENGEADSNGNVWKDGPGGEDNSTWWMSVATIDGESSTNELVSGTSWSEPVRVTGYDGTGYECGYKNSPNLVTPPTGDDWSSTPSPVTGYQYTWMRMRSSKDEAWSYMRITGERGSDGNSLVIKGDLSYVGPQNSRPGTAQDFELMLIGTNTYEWAKENNTYRGMIYMGNNTISSVNIANGDCYLYKEYFFICVGETNGLYDFQVTSVQGPPGESYMTYIAYARNSTGSGISQTWSSGKNYIGVAVLKLSEHPNWPSEYTLYRWSEFHGQDGIGQEFIFARNDSDTNSPGLNENATVNGKTKANDEFIPSGWTDNPQPVADSTNCHVQWVSHRTKKNGAWGSFSTPVVWNRWAKDGTSIDVKGSLDKVATTAGTTNYILIPSSAGDYANGTTRVIGDLYINRTKKADVANGDTYLYNGYFFICSGKSGNYYSWSITAAKGDQGDNAYVHIRYADDNTGRNETETWSFGKDYIAIIPTHTATLPEASALPRKWIKFSGQDGPGQEFIFIKTKDDNDTFNPSPETLDAIQSDEYYAIEDPRWGKWNDDPVELSPEFRIQWVSQRTRDKNGQWSKFSKPTIWGRYATDGTGITVKGVLQNVGQATDFQNYILTDSYTPDSSKSCRGKLYIGGTEVTNVANGDTYSYNGYFFICAGSTNGIYDWSIMKAKGDDGKSSYTHIRYSDTDSTTSGSISATWEAGMKFIGFATTDQSEAPSEKSAYTWCKFAGNDGISQEFIYCLSDTLTQDMINITKISLAADATFSSNNKTFQDDEFLPGSAYSGDNNWTDDPLDVEGSTGKQLQWISSRIKKDGEWQHFSRPSLWTKFPGSAYNLTLGNQNLDAVLFGTGVVRPSSHHDGVEAAIVAGNCAGTTVNYLIGNQSISTTFTLEADQNVTIYVLTGSGSSASWKTFTGQGSHNIAGSLSNFEIYVACDNKSVNQWTVVIKSADNVSKTLTVTRTAFAPSISLGFTSYGYSQDEHGNITYTPSKTNPIDITYLSNGKITNLDAFTSYGYYVHARYVNESGSAGSWTRVAPPSGVITLENIVGSSNNPDKGSIEFEVSDNINNSQNHQIYYRATVSIVASADLQSVKTYLLDGNAAITGHLWAKDGRIGNWIINATDANASTINLSGTEVVASYDSNYPLGSLRSLNGTIVFDPSESSPNIKILSGQGAQTNYSIIMDKEGFKTVNSESSDPTNYIKIDGSGWLAGNSISWGPEGDNLKVQGNIEALSGKIGCNSSGENGWEIKEGNIESSPNANNTITLDSSNGHILLSRKSNTSNVSVLNEVRLSAGYQDSSEGIGIYVYNGSSDGINTPKKSTSILAPEGFQISKDQRKTWNTGGASTDLPIVLKADGSGWLAAGNISWGSDGSQLKVSGEITATSGSIGGWYIGNDCIRSNDPSTASSSSDNYISLEAPEGRLTLYNYSSNGNSTSADQIRLTTGLSSGDTLGLYIQKSRTASSESTNSTVSISPEGFQISKDQRSSWNTGGSSVDLPITLRADGSGWLASGNIAWQDDGCGSLGPNRAITWDSSGLKVSGEIEATSGSIGGWDIGETTIYSTDTNNGADLTLDPVIGLLASKTLNQGYQNTSVGLEGLIIKSGDRRTQQETVLNALYRNGSGSLASGNIHWDESGYGSLGPNDAITWSSDGLKVSGEITAASGTIGGWKIGETLIYKLGTLNDGTDNGSGIRLDSDTGTINICKVTEDYSSALDPYVNFDGITISPENGIEVFSDTKIDGRYVTSKLGIDGSGWLANGNISWESDGTASIVGSITTTSGEIGGWKIGDNSLGKTIRTSDGGSTTSKSIVLDASKPGIYISDTQISSSGGGDDDDLLPILRYSGTTMSLSPDDGFLIETGSDARLTLAKIDLEGNGILNNGAILWSSDGSGSLGYNGVKWKSDGSGSLAKGMISWDSSGTFHIGSDNNIDGYYEYGFDLTDSYLRLGGGQGYEHQYFTVNMTSNSPSVTISIPGSGYHGAGGNTTTFDNSGMQTTGSVDCGGLSITSYSTDHKSHASLTASGGLIVANDTDNLSSPYSQVTNESVKTPKVIVGVDGCYMTYLPVYTNVCYTQISSVSGIYLTGGNVICGEYGSSTPTYNAVTASAFNQSSDERLKTKISDISLTAEQISKAPAIAYHWNYDETKTRRVGTIAQYWQNVLPEVVVEDDLGNLGLNYSELSAISVISLAKEIVELKKRIEELENK